MHGTKVDMEINVVERFLKRIKEVSPDVPDELLKKFAITRLSIRYKYLNQGFVAHKRKIYAVIKSTHRSLHGVNVNEVS